MSDNIYKDKATLLKNAIRSENDGYTFYDLLSREVRNADARRRLENLRNDENRHRTILMELFGRVVGGDIGDLPAEGISPLREAFIEGKLKKLGSEIEYINLAIEAELAATKFYNEGMQVVDDAEFKSILNQLADEENSHYEILMAEREALSGNYYWFSSDDTAPMED